MDTAIKGRVLFDPGPWGTSRPLRHSGVATVFLMDKNGPIFSASGNVDIYGRFLITFALPAMPSTDFYIEIENTCSGEKHMHHVLRPPKPGSFIISPDDVGDISVPWEPPDAELVHVNSRPFKDTRQFAKKLAALYRSPDYPINISLERESIDGTGKDYTPAQKLIIPLMAPREGFFKHLVEDVQDELVSTKSGNLSGVVGEILDRFGTVDIAALEKGVFLNRLLAEIQRAFATNSYTEKMMEEPAHDMAAACTVLFAGALMKKDKAKVSIHFRSWNLHCVSGSGMRVVDVISVHIGKS
jgi:hypothetical protein